MSTLMHLGRVSAARATLEAPKERAASTALVPTRAPVARALTVGDVMARFPSTVRHDASLYDAWGELHSTGDSHLVVVDLHRRPVGVIDKRTVALEWPPGPLGPHRTPVHTVLRGSPRPRVRGGDDLATAARVMVGSGADAVPVVDEAGRLFGLITVWHLAQLMARGDLEATRREVRRAG